MLIYRKFMNLTKKVMYKSIPSFSVNKEMKSEIVIVKNNSSAAQISINCLVGWVNRYMYIICLKPDHKISVRLAKCC